MCWATYNPCTAESHFINAHTHPRFILKVDGWIRTLSTDVCILLFVAIHEASVDVVWPLAERQRWHKVNNLETQETVKVAWRSTPQELENR